MKAEITAACAVTTITGVERLDPVNVVFQDTGPGQGRVWIECYGKAWATWWGAMGARTVRQFVADCDTDYLHRNLQPTGTKAEQAYLERICTVVIATALQQEAEAVTARAEREGAYLSPGAFLRRMLPYRPAWTPPSQPGRSRFGPGGKWSGGFPTPPAERCRYETRQAFQHSI